MPSRGCDGLAGELGNVPVSVDEKRLRQVDELLGVELLVVQGRGDAVGDDVLNGGIPHGPHVHLHV
jgi:hypothetical protein